MVQSRLQCRRQRNGRHQVLIFVLLAVAIVGVVVAGVAHSLSGKFSNQANQLSIQSSSRTKGSGAKLKLSVDQSECV